MKTGSTTAASLSRGITRDGMETLGLGIGLMILVAIAFAPALQNGFVNFDDEDYVVANQHVQQGINATSVVWAFTTFRAGNWHPLTWMSHMLDVGWYGLNPAGHHLTGILLHTMSTLLLFGLLRRMTRKTWASFFVSGLWAVHPLRVESVAWVAERKDVLSVFLGLATLWMYVRHVERRKGGETKSGIYYLASIGCFAAGLLAKPMLVTLPFAMLLLDYWPLGRMHVRRPGEGGESLGVAGAEPPQVRFLILEKIPFFVLAIISSMVTFVAQRNGGAVASMGKFSLSLRFENVLVSYGKYLAKLACPTKLAAFYPTPEKYALGIVVLAGALFLAATVAALVLRKSRPWFFVGWFWFVGMMVPVIGLVQVGNQAMADRYTYLPSIGIFVAVVWFACECVGNHRKKFLVVGGFAVVMVLTGMTRQQVRTWKDSETLFRHALAVGPDNYPSHINLGNALFAQGRLDETVREFTRAVELRPDLVLTHNRLATALRARGKIDAAVAEFQEILKLRPNDAGTHTELGAIFLDKGQTDEAIRHYAAVVALQPSSAAAHYNLGIALSIAGKFEQAVSQLSEAARIDPDNARINYNLGVAFFRGGHVQEALSPLRAAVRLDPGNAKAHFQLALALLKSGKAEEGRFQTEEAIRLQPDYPEAVRQLQMLKAAQPQ